MSQADNLASLATNVNSSGVLQPAGGGTGTSTSTGTGSVVLSNSPTLVTPTLGSASATQLATGLGSAGAPALTFTGDTNTGIFSPTADTIAFSEGGVESMRIDSAGRVGIGQSSPTAKLEVIGEIYASQATANTQQIRLTPQASGENIIYSTYAGTNSYLPLSFNVGGAERLRIATSGNVGVGTNNPAYKFQVEAAQNANDIVSRNSTTGGVVRMSINDSYGQIGTIGSYPLVFLTNDTERMRINTSGQVAIGIATATSKLTVDLDGASTKYANFINGAGTIAFQAYGTFGTAHLRLTYPSVVDWDILVGSGGQLTYSYNSTERFRFGPSGQFGIGGANYGSSGQVFTSNGSGSAPSWAAVSGTITTTTGSPAYYGSRAWVNFNGTGTVAIRGSVNVSSISDNGTGDYSVNFSTAMPDANYAVGAGISYDNNGSANGTYAYVYNLATGSFRTQTRGYFGGLSASALNDSLTVTFVVAR